ncbi:MAG: 4Fe-4S binding protein, partial [Dissulfurispiraceae bacterium]
GALPYAPFIDYKICLRSKGEDCGLCKSACPVDDAFNYDDKENIIERNIGAIVIAIGSELYDCSNIPNLGRGKLEDIYTGAEFERMLSSNGPTDGEIRTSSGIRPESAAIIHCVGSLDKNHREYCSGVCCQYAFKFNHIIEKKLPGTKIYHFYKMLSVPGKEEFTLYNHAMENHNATFIRYNDIRDINVNEKGGKKSVKFKDAAGKKGTVPVDMVILCPAVVPAEDSVKLGAVLEAAQDKFGFFEELHGRLDSSQSKIKGVYLAGTCQSPMDIQKAMSQGMAVAGHILSGLVVGRKLEINPITAVIDSERCSGCRVCISVCPYKAIAFDADKEVSAVTDVLCQGCGACVAACPCSAIKSNHFTNEEIIAEIEGVLA